jgi:probable metal-binding protein
MNNTQHIHQVIFLIEQHNGQWTSEELVEAISNEWGADVHFGACSGNAFPKEYALDFLLNRHKVVLSEDEKVTLHPSMHICAGHEEFQGS